MEKQIKNLIMMYDGKGFTQPELICELLKLLYNIERRIVRQEWYETEYSKTGWDGYGWYFDGGEYMDETDWTIIEYIDSDKFGNPIIAIAEREIKI